MKTQETQTVAPQSYIDPPFSHVIRAGIVDQNSIRGFEYSRNPGGIGKLQVEQFWPRRRIIEEFIRAVPGGIQELRRTVLSGTNTQLDGGIRQSFVEQAYPVGSPYSGTEVHPITALQYDKVLDQGNFPPIPNLEYPNFQIDPESLHVIYSVSEGCIHVSFNVQDATGSIQNVDIVFAANDVIANKIEQQLLPTGVTLEVAINAKDLEKMRTQMGLNELDYSRKLPSLFEEKIRRPLLEIYRKLMPGLIKQSGEFGGISRRRVDPVTS
jgi:hypothetical protein